MDTISRENNSMLPVGGIIVGVVALALGLYSAVSISKVKTQLNAQQEKVDKIDDIASQVSAASAKGDSANARVDALQKSTQDAVTTIGNAIGETKAEIAKLEESSKRPARGAAHGGGPVVAGPGEYVVKSGDTGARIARANGCSVADLLAVNSGIDWKHLKVGQKVKLPEKKS